MGMKDFQTVTHDHGKIKIAVGWRNLEMGSTKCEANVFIMPDIFFPMD